MVSVPSDLSTRAALSLGALSALALAYKLLVAKPALPPGTHAPRRAPSSHWLLGDLPAVLRNAGRFNEYVLETTRACGEQPWLQRAPLMPDMVIVATPTMFEEITRTQFESFGKGDFTRESVYEIFGDSFFSLDGPAWFHQRKTAVKFFTGRMYREVAMPVTHAHVMRLLRQLDEAQKSGKEIDFTGVLNAFALQNFAELGFGLNIDEVDPMPLHIALEEAFVGVLHRMQKPTWLWKLQKRLNVGEERKFRETTSFIRSFVLALVRDSLDKSAQKALDDDRPARTMVELFIDAMRHGEGEFTPELLCDLAIMFMIAGRDTTVAVLEWFFHTLSKHPDVERRIREELWENVPELMDGSVETISIEQAAKLVYLEAAIKETMRLYPAATLSPRETLRDTVLCDGTFIPKGMKIGLAPYTMARLESVWGPDAAEYKPTRFLDPATGKVAIVPQSKFYGFGAGARNCIGMNLALLEMKMMVSSLLSRFRLEMAPNDGSYKFSAGIVIDTPLKATVHAAPSRIAKAA